MDVSNSTGENTGYRVLGSGGAAPDDIKGANRNKKKWVEVNGQTFEVLTEGTLAPNTYVTVKIAGNRGCMVEFFQGSKSLCTCQVPYDNGTSNKGTKTPAVELLVALAKNGKGTPQTYVFRRQVAKAA